MIARMSLTSSLLRDRRENVGVELRNLTPHPLVLVDRVGRRRELAAASGSVPRVVTTRRPADGFAGLAVPAVVEIDDAVRDLPEPVPGVLWIVSRRVRVACPLRLDLASPVDVERDGDGRVVAAGGLAVNPGRTRAARS